MHFYNLQVLFTVYEHVLHSDLPNKYFGMRHWKQEFGILGKSENINRITVTNEILEAAFIVIYQLNQAFWNQTHKLSIIFIHSYNFDIFTFITMFIIHHYSKKIYCYLCKKTHMYQQSFTIFFQIQKLFKVSDIHDTGIIWTEPINTGKCI